MNDNDPRPMPTEVLRAYREPVDLRALLMSSVYSEMDRRDVLDALMHSLIAKHGDVWISAGSKEVRVSTRVKQTKSVELAIELLSSVEEYGGSDGVLPLLAQAMQPMWALWWESFEWTSWGGVVYWRSVAQHALGQRQLAWLAAQYARTVIDRTRPEDRIACVNAIEAAETWGRVPSEANRTKARLSYSAARDAEAASYAAEAAARAARTAGASAARSGAVAARSAAYAAASAANATDVAAFPVASVAAARAATDDAARAAAWAADAEAISSYPRLCELTKRLITPTLVTSAARSSGATRVRSSGV